MILRVENYREQPAGSKKIAIFDIYMPDLQMTFHNWSLIQGSKGTFISGPSYMEIVGDQKKFSPYITMSKERGAEFRSKVEESLKQYNAPQRIPKPDDDVPF